MAKRLSVFFFTLILPFVVWAQADTFPELFHQGTQHYSAKEYDKARDAFAKALEKDPTNATTLTNLALAQYQLGNKPLAIGFLRKALAYDPDLAPAKAGLKFALSQMEIKEVPHQIETLESLHTKFLAPVPLPVYLTLGALLLFASCWLMLSYAGRRRRAQEQENPPPPFPMIATILLAGFIVSTGLLAFKFYDLSVTRATLVDEKVSLQSAPGPNEAAILDLYGGMEVLVRATSGEWRQVTYPGSLTGWVKASSLLITSGQ